MEGDLTKETRKSRKKKKREERNLSDEAGWMVFDVFLVVEIYLSYIQTHLQQDITQNYPKSQSLSCYSCASKVWACVVSGDVE